MSHYHNQNKTNTVEIHCKNVPQRVQKKQWFQFVNKATHNKKWMKHIKSNHEWVIVVKSFEKNDWKNALNGKNIASQRITVYIKDTNRGYGGYNNYNKYNKYNKYNNKRQSAFGHNDNNKNFRSTKGGNNKYSKTFTKHLTNKQQQDMLNLCGKRYNSENKMLNLKQIISTEQENWACFSNQSFVSRLFTIIGNNCNDVKSIDFSSNNIQTLEPFKNIIKYAPYLENLSLLDNPIKSFSEVNYLNCVGHNLRELYLRNLNLLNEVSGVKQLYVFEIERRFPNLRLLDGECINNVNLISFGKAVDEVASSFKQNCTNIPVSSHMPCNDQQTIYEFINNYYKLFDSTTGERRKIINLYHCDAIFTLTYTPIIDTPTPTENKSANFKQVSSSCNRSNRNLIDKIYAQQARFKQLNKVKHGNIDIIKYLTDEFVQRTKHQMTYMSIDCHPIKIQNKQFMQVLMNGYYAENQDVARKFQRTWLLMQENTGIIISNDQLHLGGVIPQSKLVKHAPASSIADLNKQNKKGNGVGGSNGSNGNSLLNFGGDVSIQMNAGNNQNQQDLITKVANHCNCPMDISKQALEASNWDPQVAVTKIETLKSQRNQQ